MREEIVAAEMRMVGNAAPHAPTPPSTTTDAMPRRASDRIIARVEGDASIVDIYPASPVGGVSISPPKSGWPPEVRLRLHEFTELEGLSAKARSGTLRCEMATSIEKDVPHLCMIDDVPVDAIRRLTDGFEVTLPQLLLAEQNEAIEVRWVDRYR
ncbi:MAG TPA: hypothetical protein VFB54_11960 [Burkholderiales bacterium]|nr:hypothetical protein [Burkholderiales bacterium]